MFPVTVPVPLLGDAVVDGTMNHLVLVPLLPLM